MIGHDRDRGSPSHPTGRDLTSASHVSTSTLTAVLLGSLACIACSVASRADSVRTGAFGFVMGSKPLSYPTCIKTTSPELFACRTAPQPGYDAWFYGLYAADDVGVCSVVATIPLGKNSTGSIVTEEAKLSLAQKLSGQFGPYLASQTEYAWTPKSGAHLPDDTNAVVLGRNVQFEGRPAARLIVIFKNIDACAAALKGSAGR